MKTKQIFLFGRNGEIIEALREMPEWPLIELDNNLKMFGNIPYVSEFSEFDREPFNGESREWSFEKLKDRFSGAYKSWGRFGYLGDVIVVKRIEIEYEENTLLLVYALDYIGRLAIAKPGLAADLIPIIKTGPDEYYFVGIKRKYNPGKGLTALMGGFIDVNGYHLDTAVETVIHEAKEEIGLDIKLLDRSDLEKPSPKKVSILINYQNKNFFGELLYHCNISTGDEEKLPSIGLKRVYATTAYALLLDMTGAGLDEAKIRQWLKAGDDADELVVVNLKESDNLKFGLKHHANIFNSCRYLYR
jgi:8-oxo-dGTP pyrophosphatase MutT (NUDIX family)